MHADDIFRAIGRFSVKFRWVVVIAWLAAAFVIPSALPSLASVTQGNNSDFLPASAPSEQAATLAAPFGGTNLVPVPVVAAISSGTFTAADQAWLSTLETDLHKVPTVVKVNDLGVSATRAGVNGQAAQLQVLSNVSQNNQGAQTDLINNLRAEIKDSSPPTGVQAHLAGALAIQVDQQKQSGNTGNEVELVAAVFILILLFLIFRAALAPFITLIPAFLSVAISGPVVAELANHGLKVSSLAQLLLTVLVLGAGTDYGLFLVFRVRENRRAGQDSHDAVINALTKVGESITFSALTVVAALLSLLAASFQIYSNLGIPLAIGIGVMLLAGLTLLPALLAIFGKAAFWPSKPKPGTSSTGALGQGRYPGGQAPGGRAADRRDRVRRAVRRGHRLQERRVRRHHLRTGRHRLRGWAEPAGQVLPLLVRQPDQPRLQAVDAGLGGPGGHRRRHHPTGAQPAVHRRDRAAEPGRRRRVHADRVRRAARGAWLRPVSATAPAIPAAFTGKVTPTQWAQAYQEYRATAQYVDPAGTTIQFETGLTAGDPSSTAALNAVPALRAEAATVGTTLHATATGVGGEAPAFYDISQISNSDLAHVIPIAIIVIGILLALVMRSLVAPIYLIASVAISYFAALGFAVIVFIELGNSGGITFILPFLLFIFLLALGEDYNILVMTRIREEAHRMPLREAVSRAISVTGTTVTSAGLVLAGTFAVFAVVGGSGSGGSQIRDVGIGLAVGVIMDTFVVRTVLVPCTVVLLGRWNWWPSKLEVDSPDSVSADADALGLTLPDAAAGPADTASDSSTDMSAPEEKHRS